MLEILVLRCYCFVAVLFSNTLSNINFNVKILTEDTEVNKQKLSYNVKKDQEKRVIFSLLRGDDGPGRHRLQEAAL